MNKSSENTSPPWHYWQSFLAVIQQGSLSAAAAVMGQSQPTLSRHIQQLEQELALQLFQRTPRGLIPTEAATALVAGAEKMGEAATQMLLSARGLENSLSGTVRISANEIVGTYLLPGVLADFMHQYPEVHIELQISNAVSSLSQREADLALRMTSVTQPDLVCQRLPDLPLGFFAHTHYLQHRGTPVGLEDLSHHHVLGFDKATFFREAAEKMGIAPHRNRFAFRSDHMLAQIAMARAGGGLMVTHRHLAVHWPEMVQVLTEVPLPPLPFYLLCHQDTRHNALIRTLRKHIYAAFQHNPYAHYGDIR